MHMSSINSGPVIKKGLPSSHSLPHHCYHLLTCCHVTEVQNMGYIITKQYPFFVKLDMWNPEDEPFNTQGESNKKMLLSCIMGNIVSSDFGSYRDKKSAYPSLYCFR